jgi:hypothetical protein
MPSIVFVLPGGAERRVTVPAGTSLMHAAVDHDVPGIVGECGGCRAPADQPARLPDRARGCARRAARRGAPAAMTSRVPGLAHLGREPGDMFQGMLSV